VTLLLGIAMQVSFAIAGMVRLKDYRLITAVPVYPLYWILHSFTSYRALWQLFRTPHYWEKTTHGLTRFER
jgi:hypothetical protein